MEVTDEMLQIAMKKAVEVGLVPKFAIGEETYLKNWSGVKAILEAALAAIPEMPASRSDVAQEERAIVAQETLRFRSASGRIFSTSESAFEPHVTTTRARQLLNDLYGALDALSPGLPEEICKRRNA